MDSGTVLCNGKVLDLQNHPYEWPQKYVFESTGLRLDLEEGSDDLNDSTSLNIFDQDDHPVLVISFSRSNDAILVRPCLPPIEKIAVPDKPKPDGLWRKEIHLAKLRRAFGHGATNAVVEVVLSLSRIGAIMLEVACMSK